MKAESGTSFEEAILEKINMLIRPPSPYPKNAKLIPPRKT
jgi:hypothetical protein